ncbi:outer membrane lipoprotein-sorting protein [Salsuginibacillus halophilus]|uniref:Outer membrane lipoprotein-sorting protein n=1 Tax=Salsuginibacillus halophilus TaxID=517424 RepID=A0A2P8H9R6_9BACI|nr:hypothetical protein [Salsuginibacillus halophilus]PSL42973.1 outer membrane lipoprotein-sorting protein [Salsuginibacillus halophilus]
MHKFIGSLLAAAVLLVACNEDGGGSSVSAEDIIIQAAEEVDQLEDYYTETAITITIGDEVVDETLAKEWFVEQADGLYTRTEMEREGEGTRYIVSDAETSLTYQEGDEEAVEREVLEAGMVEQSEMQQQMDRLSNYQDTHTIELIGETEVQDRSAYHLSLEADEDSAEGDGELWIDQETWLTLKQESDMEGMSLEIEVLTFDTAPEIPEGLWELDLPEDVEVVDQEALSSGIETDEEELTLEEVHDHLGEPFLYDAERFSEAVLTTTVVEGGEPEEELVLHYIEDGDPYARSIIQDDDGESNTDVDLPGREDITVRGEDGHMTTSETLQLIAWPEDGLRYSLYSDRPDLDGEELMETAENMEIFEP